MIGDRRPPWSTVTAAGIFRVPRTGGRFDRHYHDCDEYWLVYRGRAIVLSEGVEFEVGPGDIVCTQAGEEHDVVSVAEDLEAFFWEDQLPAGGARGHLHRTPEAKAGHDVATMP
jgi:mannose-6-phosphate isomerase-like protein (cupin superfamily)